MFYTGVVENRQDPLQLGRCQVRIVGLHTHDKTLLPTMELPWAHPIQPVTSAAMNGIGWTPIGPVEGSTVIVMFTDEARQFPVILGTVGGIPSAPVAIGDDDSGEIGEVPAKSIVLRTIEGPVTGKQLTFKDTDPSTGVSNLTANLKPNMKVIGFGLPEDTIIVTVDDSTKITINNQVTGYGENIIKFADAPSNLDAVNKSKLEGVLTDGSGSPVLDGSGNPVRAGATETSPSTASIPAQNNVNSSIPIIPPKKSTSNEAKAKEGIKALINACDKVGLTTKEQKCALLGIAGGESAWIPQNEGYNYSESRLRQIFTVTDAEVAKYANAQTRGMSREEFFSWIYGPTKRGKNFFGHQTDADGGKYYGRGFIQLTGRSNYKRYNDLAKKLGLSIDILNDPDSLDKDINVSAIIAALYIKDRVPAGVNPSAHPGYFFAAKKAVGINSPDIAARKLSYYEYFYGASAGGAAEKDAGAPLPFIDTRADENGIGTSQPTPGPSASALKSGSDNTGFRDPNNKYPLKDYINEPDTNRLARGIIEGTIIEKKDGQRARGIPKAVGQGTWDQPLPTFGAQYPFNKVFETESGHIMEFDDSPGQERIHTYHRAGTYTEIDPMGTQVNYIIGDNYVIMERNGCVSIKGECNITVDGNANIYARSDANIQVDQNATVHVGNNLDIAAASDIYLSAAGDILMKANGDFALQANNVSIKADSGFNIQAGSDGNILTGGSLNVDYAEGQFGNGAEAAFEVDITPQDPANFKPVNPTVPYLEGPPRQIENKQSIETPEQYNTPEGRAKQNEESKRDGVPNAPPPVAQEASPPPTGGASAKPVPVDCKIIYTTKNFTNDYTITKNFSLGMLMDGGVNGKHRLQDQMLTGEDGKTLRLFTVQEIVCNLAVAAQNILEPYLEILPNGIAGYKRLWTVTSGYRLKGVIPQESANSDHCKGHCFDVCLMPMSPVKTYELVQKMEKIIKYDQIILEYNYSSPTQVWVHTGYRPQGNRGWAFTMVNHATYKRNAKGIPDGFYLVENCPPPQKK